MTTRRHSAALIGVLLAVIAAVACGAVGDASPDGPPKDHGQERRAERHRAEKRWAEKRWAEKRWVGTWAAAPVDSAKAPSTPRSVRNVVHTTIGGTHARVTLSNLFGREALHVEHVSLAVRAQGAAAVPGTLKAVTFAGHPSVAVPAHGEAVSDPLAFRVPYDGDLLVTVYAPHGPATRHTRAQQTSYLADGDRTQDPAPGAYTRRTTSWHHLTAVDVLNPGSPGAITVIGDSITAGAGSTPGTNRRWPDVLADRLRRASQPYGVLNAGIGGNQLLLDGKGPSGLSRFARDVLDRRGTRTVVIALGVNDILRGPHQHDPGRIAEGLAALAGQARARGLRVVGATLPPFGGRHGDMSDLEPVRKAVNERIRRGGLFDDVLDFDRALRDPRAPERLSPVYDSGDGLHPNDAGYRRMGAYIPLEALLPRTGRGPATPAPTLTS